MTLTDARNLAAVIGIALAIITYATNSYFQFRNRRIENLKCYFDAHDKLFEPKSFIVHNIRALEDGTYVRKSSDGDGERLFNRLLGDIEKVAFLTSYGAASIEVQVYMFGWFAQKIQPHLTERERENVFWELAIHYLDELKKAADDYEKMPNEQRDKYLRKNALVYNKYRR